MLLGLKKATFAGGWGVAGYGISVRDKKKNHREESYRESNSERGALCNFQQWEADIYLFFLSFKDQKTAFAPEIHKFSLGNKL